MSNDAISILFPKCDAVYKELSDTTCHDLGLDFICQQITNKETEQKLLMTVLSRMTMNPEVAEFREDVFADILRFPKMRQKMMDLLNHVQFLKEFGSLKSNYDKKAGIWDLLHRLDEINDYIKCVEGIRECLSSEEIQSTGLKNLLQYVNGIYEEGCFAEMKKDVAALKADTSNLRSVTLGININERFEAESIGVISINNKPFKSSGIVSNFAEAIKSKDGVHDGNDWNGEMHYHAIDRDNIVAIEKMDKLAGYSAMMKTPFLDAKTRSTIVNVPDQDGNGDVTHFMDKVMNQMLNLTVRKLREVLTKYVSITIVGMTALIPEFIYYIKFAEYIEKMMDKKMQFCEAKILDGNDSLMQAKGIYNMKLAFAALQEPMDIVTNDLTFDQEHMVYILTGANRGGKTTITQAIGLLYVLAQGGIYVPGEIFAFAPVDCIYTHFPADEDKTMDLGRLGEECTRFKEMYQACTKDSLLLLNETFSTTSFEEGYFIARDSVKAILTKQVRTIYNTHMHKLAFDIEDMNRTMAEQNIDVQAASLIVKTDGGNRSFKIEVAAPVGMSYAKDIAEKYGVTYEMLTKE